VNRFPVDLLLRLVMRQGLLLDALGWPEQEADTQPIRPVTAAVHELPIGATQ
jgi:hypothetical protein